MVGESVVDVVVVQVVGSTTCHTHSLPTLLPVQLAIDDVRGAHEMVELRGPSCDAMELPQVLPSLKRKASVAPATPVWHWVCPLSMPGVSVA